MRSTEQKATEICRQRNILTERKRLDSWRRQRVFFRNLFAILWRAADAGSVR